ncbi:hypothetical protein [Amycolatopsis sp. PS_44_ISF1]|uniref:hypothetical protein n=1 Tax=Amycolatopsis sp. PS_44_ISF1 TaxID=2974917 RepID=UPI0028DE336C|nr:hypothetical protein [Amycolatopsis sp. PS_44_ISF1]MDT8912544.1 glycosyltransferase family 39 protein [Amycolatopsis sp. PS_44_ISF1]
MTTLAEPAVPARAETRWYQRPHLHAVLLYLFVRGFSVALLALFAAKTGQPLLGRLTAWDGQFYLDIADYGYFGTTRGLYDAAGNYAPFTPLAFFPAYPTLLRIFTPVMLGSTALAGLLVSTVSGCLAAAAIFRLARRVDGGVRTGLLLVALWAGAPLAITQSMVFTEALFTAFAAWALVGVIERRWLLAAACCLGAGLTRSTAAVLIAVVGVAALIAFFRARERWTSLVCVALCPLGLLGWWIAVALWTGNPTGWFDLEWDNWRTRFDGGTEAVRFTWENLVAGPSVMGTLTVLIMLGAAVLAVLLVKTLRPLSQWWPLAAYGAGVVLLVVGTAGLPTAKPRFLIPGFILLFPIARGLAARRPGTAVAAAAAFVLLGGWISAYSLTGWRYVI